MPRIVPVAVCLVALSCKTSGQQAGVKDAATQQAATSLVPPSVVTYAVPHYGLYFIGADEVMVPAVPGQPNRNFDPTRPTMIHFPGWTPGEVKKTKARTFNFSRDYNGAPDVEMVKVWNDAGWNFGYMDWTQFADTEFEPGMIGALPAAKVYDVAERRIWTRDDQNKLVYHLSDGTAVNVPDASVTAIFADAYQNFMTAANYTGPEVRFYGHSLGTQLAITVANEMFKRAAASTTINANLLPTRISLTDITSSNCAHPWLPSATPVHRVPSGTCPDYLTPGDWVSERLLTYVKTMQAMSPPIAYDAYRCWLVSSSNWAPIAK